LSWSGVRPEKAYILPNSIDLRQFRPAPKSPKLLRRHDLAGKTIVMTVGRLVSAERYKGFDEVLDLMPMLLEDVPNLVYLIVGDGNDRGRLERKAITLGVADHVVFTGFVSEAEKCDYYNLA